MHGPSPLPRKRPRAARLPRLAGALALALPLALPSCGGSADPKALTDEGSAALGSGDFDLAAEKFSAALDAFGGDTQNVQYERALLGHVEATLRKDAAAARDEFLDFARAHSSTVTPDEFSRISREFASAKKYREAIDVLDAGMKMHAESPVLKKLAEDIKVAAEKDGDSGALDKMAGLGYI